MHRLQQLLLACAAAAACSSALFAAAARVQQHASVVDDPAAQLLLSSGMHVLSAASHHPPPGVDLGLLPSADGASSSMKQRWQRGRHHSISPAAAHEGSASSAAAALADPALVTVFAADSVFARSATRRDATQQQHAGAAAGSPAGGVAKPGGASDRAAAFDPARAAQLAQLQSISYCADLDAVGAWSCSRCAQVPGFQPTLVHFDAEWDLLAYAGYWPALDAKVVVFRGTDSSSWYNWAENMRAWRTDASYPVPGAPKALRIHSGFLVMWNSSSMAATVKAAFAELHAAHPGGTTLLLGHSMGGALAHLAALDLKIGFQLPDVKVYTFGSPRVGNSVFASFFEEHVSEAWRFTHGRDIVPSVPPILLGFHHVSREVWLVDVDDPASGGGGSGPPQQRVVVCDDSGEDPTCHNSACRLGLCTSVADHLVYFGGHMYRGGEC